MKNSILQQQVEKWSILLFSFQAPRTGRYTFYVAGDDECRMRISRNRSPRYLRKIIQFRRNLWTNPNQWNKYVGFLHPGCLSVALMGFLITNHPYVGIFIPFNIPISELRWLNTVFEIWQNCDLDLIFWREVSC
jgi:hypothetical protein